MDDRNIFVWTGPGGARTFEIELAIEAFRFMNGKEPTEDERKEIESNFPYSNYDAGTYEIGPNGVKYMGLFDKDKKSAFYTLKGNDGKYYEEEWRDTKRISRIEITEEQFNKFKSSLNGK